MSKKISIEQEKEIVEFYLSKPMTYQAIQEKFNLSSPTIGKILKKYNVKPWNKSQIFSPDLRENYFENIDTEAKAYFLGLMITDGNIFDNYKSANQLPNINLTLNEKDKYILECFKKELRLNKKITLDNRGCCQICCFSRTMANDLKKFGVVPQKTFITKFPTNIPETMHRHLIRGLIDGDGNISFHIRRNRKVHSKAIRLCGANEQFIEDVKQFLLENVGLQSLYITKQNFQNPVWTLNCSNKRDLEILIHYLYDDATIYMKRKKNISELILNEIGQYRDN